MHSSLTTSLSLATALLATAASARVCHNITVPVDISARTGVFDNMMTPQTNLDATTFAQNLTRRGQNFTDVALTGYQTTTGSYNISAMFCLPSNCSTKPTLQILTHGIGFDKTYWDLPYHNYNYSYIKDATDKYGYATLSYDRLGIGNSSHGEPKNEIQSFLEIAALAKMTDMLRQGTFPQVNTTFDKIVHVGHSFGSAQTYALVAMYPNISDGIVLTGFSMNASYVGYFAAGNDWEQAALNSPIRFGSPVTSAALQEIYPSELTDLFAPINLFPPAPNVAALNYTRGYITNSNVGAQQYLFFFPGNFDIGILYVAEQTKQPVTVGEALTLGSLPMTNSFAGPVFLIAGEHDLPYCGGDCLHTGDQYASIPAAVTKNFPNASAFEAYIQPATGHGLNPHYNSTAGYDVIQNWLASHGLAATM